MNNRVEFQNSLTKRNLALARAAGSLLTNYSWEEIDVLSAIPLAARNQIPLANIYYGIDVWAQNVRHGGPKRVTYPAKGGGGTNTGVAVARLGELGLSAGIFAPAWPFEHCAKQARAVDHSMWDGDEIPEDLDCDCGDRPPHHNAQHPITRHAEEYPAGSRNFFYTDFNRAFVTHDQQLDSIYNGYRLHSQLGAQSILPHLLRPQSPHQPDGKGPSLYGQLHDDPARLIIGLQGTLVPSKPAVGTSDCKRLKLFKLEMIADGSLEATFHFRRPLEWMHLEIGFLLHYSGGLCVEKPSEASVGPQRMLFCVMGAMDVDPDARLQQIDVYVRGSLHALDSPIPLLELTEMVIAPVKRNTRPLLIDSIRIEQREQGEERHRRLLWSYREVGGDDDADRISENYIYPHSDLTGPFAHYLVNVNEICIGRAYATEFVLSNDVFEHLGNGMGVEVRITGVKFDGGRCPSAEIHLCEGSSEWHIVQGRCLDGLQASAS